MTKVNDQADAISVVLVIGGMQGVYEGRLEIVKSVFHVRNMRAVRTSNGGRLDGLQWRPTVLIRAPVGREQRLIVAAGEPREVDGLVGILVVRAGDQFRGKRLSSLDSSISRMGSAWACERTVCAMEWFS